MAHILKCHTNFAMYDGAGNPLSHLSFCFSKCIKSPTDKQLSREEKDCASSLCSPAHCIDRSVAAHQQINQSAGDLYREFTKTASNYLGRTIDEMDTYKTHEGA